MPAGGGTGAGELSDPPMPDRRQPSGLEIAVIGMAARVPGAGSVRSFWNNLRRGVESISRFDDRALLDAGVDPLVLAEPDYVRANAILADVDRFDAAFFGYSPREAALTDPQQRVFLECAWTAVEDAGYAPTGCGTAVGVYAGSSLSTYLLRNLASEGSAGQAADLHLLLGNDKDHVATRVAYKLGLRGPAIGVQTGCSSSLVAVHLAVQALLGGECDMALAGGVSISLPQIAGYRYEEGGVYSPDGHCRAFDADARGTVGGSGAAVVFLKRLEDARRDGDPIRAVVLGTAVNNDGAAKVGYTAPSVESQERVIRAAQQVAGVAPSTVGFVEAHGTATRLGDAVEIEALTRAFRAGTPEQGFCAVGSVKSNIGHLDAAAGVVGLIKVVLALQHRAIPPSLHFRRPNPEIDFAASPFFVNARLRDWQPRGGPLRAGVSSFGMGGTNAHVVLEEELAPPRPEDAPGWRILPLSARTRAALEIIGADLREHLEAHEELSLGDVAYTLQVGRPAFAHRQAVVARTRAEAITALSAEAPTPPRDGTDAARLAAAWVAGTDVDWAQLHAAARPRRVPLPTYPFERTRHWIEPSRPSAGPPAVSRDPDPEKWLWVPGWKRAAPLLAFPGDVSTAVLLGASGDLDGALAAELRRRGVRLTEVGTAPGEQVEPAGDAGYEESLRSLADSSTGRPQRLVLLGTAAGFYSLLDLGRAVARLAWPEPPEIVVVTRGGRDVTGLERPDPEEALAAGACPSLAQELAGLRLREVDLETTASSADDDASALADEILAGTEPSVALRGGRRWLPGFERLTLPGAAGVPRRLRRGGTYLITGGLGGVGLEIARLLRGAAAARVVLVGRSAPPSAAGERLRRLDESGESVLVLAADAAEPAELEAAFRQAEARFGEVHGVFHAAGEPPETTPAAELAVADCERIFRPKLAGLRALAEILAERSADFCLVQSSLSAVLGAAGQAPYAAAHAFMDAFVCRMRRRSLTTWSSIGWDNWHTWKHPHPGPQGRRENFHVSAEEGREVLRRLLDAPLQPHVLVSTGDLDGRYERWVRRPPLHRPDPRAEPPRPVAGRAVPRDPPAGATELLLARLWGEALGVPEVAVDDDYFELGGDSVTALQIVVAAARAGLRLTPEQLFDHPTPRELARVAGAVRGRDADQGAIAGPVALTPIQRWYLEQNRPAPGHFTLGILLGVEADLSVDALRDALRRLVEHHDVLRLCFPDPGSGTAQLDESPTVRVEEVDLSGLPAGSRTTALRERAEAADSGFDLRQGPLFRALLFEPGDGDKRALRLAAHHLLVDLRSWEILLADLRHLLTAAPDVGAARLPPKTSSYGDWSGRLAELAGSIAGREQSFWEALAEVGDQDLPVDADGPNSEGSARGVVARLDVEATRALLTELPRTWRARPAELVLAAVALSLRAWSGRDTVLVDVEEDGRQADLGADLDVSRTVGWFTSLYPLAIGLGDAAGPAAALAAVQQARRSVPNRGVGFGVLRYLAGPAAASRLAALPRARVSFLYRGEMAAGGGQPAFEVLETDLGTAGASQPRSHELQIVAGVRRGILQLELVYSQNRHQRETIEGLGRSLAGQLRELIDHCRSAAKPAWDPADFPEAGLGADELSRLMLRLAIGDSE